MMYEYYTSKIKEMAYFLGFLENEKFLIFESVWLPESNNKSERSR